MTMDSWQYESEREWQRYVVQLAHARGWLVFHVPDSRRTTPGWPDLALIRAPSFMLVELKNNHGKVSRAQQTTITALEQCGVEVHVWRPCDEEQVRSRLKRTPYKHGGVYDWQRDTEA